MRGFAPARRPRCKARPWALPCGPAYRLSKLRIPSLGFALRAMLRMSHIAPGDVVAPGEFVFACPKKVGKERTPHGAAPVGVPCGRLVPCKSAFLPICLAQSGGRPTGHPCPDVRARPDREAQGTRRARHRGGLSFGYFSLAEQRKVARPRGRIPRIKNQSCGDSRAKPIRNRS